MTELVEYITTVNAMNLDVWVKLELRTEDFSVIVWKNRDIMFSAYNQPFERINKLLEHIKIETGI